MRASKNISLLSKAMIAVLAVFAFAGVSSAKKHFGKRPTLSASITSITNENCYGQNIGSATVTAHGGVVPYTYSWSNGATTSAISGLSAGTYIATVKDHVGSTVSAAATITQAAQLVTTISSVTNISCYGGNNGAIHVSVTGGDRPYVYSWSPSGGTHANATGLSAGTYTVYVTDNSDCSVTASATITQPAQLIVNAVNTSPCFSVASAGSASANVSGGTPTYTYSWSSGQTTSNVTGLSVGTYTVNVTDNNGCTASSSVNITISLSAYIGSSTNVNCHGGNNGSATVSASGGSTPYTYSWSPSGGTSATASNLTAATYTVTVKDARGCTLSASVNITQPAAALSMSTTVTNGKCSDFNDGSITANVSGGTPSYTYSWSNGQTTSSINNLAAGTYSVTVSDSHGCTITASATVTQPNPINAPVTTTSDTCSRNIGTAIVTASGGTPPYTYSWSNGKTTSAITGLSAGTYSVTVKDANGCLGSGSGNVQEVGVAFTVSTSSAGVNCYGQNTGSATANPSVDQNYTYSWSPGGNTNQTATGLSAGTYIVTVTGQYGCSATASVTVTQPAQLVASIVTNSAGCANNNGSASASVGGGTPSYTYSWSNGKTTSSITGLSSGAYTITVTDSHGCTATASANVGQTFDGISVSTSVTPTCSSGNTGTATANISGGVSPYTYSWSPGGATTMSISNLSLGTYTVTVTDANSCSASVTATISNDPPPQVTVTAMPQTINYLQTTTLKAIGSSGTPPYQFTWLGPALNSNTGTPVVAMPSTTSVYTVTITDKAGCSTTDTITVFVNPANVETPTSCDTCLGGLNLIPGKTYLVSVWAKESNSNAGVISYQNPQMKVIFPPGDSTAPFSPSGAIIDGWQRIEGQFTVPVNATVFQIKLYSLNGNCNFDDLRVFPFNGTIKTYVYDPNTMRLAAVLDERNYATIYEYDEEGKLIRVKKETERGIMTIQESRTAMHKRFTP